MAKYTKIGTELDHFQTAGIVCPNCGYTDEDDLFEYEADEGEIECQNCHTDFIYTRNIEITYSTKLT